MRLSFFQPITVGPFFLLMIAGWIGGGQPLQAQRQEIDLSGPGWQLWQDKQASWKDDELFAPGTALSKIPSNPPTGGWDQLERQQATAVSVPGTVEQYLYRRSPEKNENSFTPGLVGVSWWYRTLDLPHGLAGKTILLNFESTRFRAEVYLNQKLVAYDLVEGTPFTLNLTGLVKDGEKAQLAVRITSPGGMWSWMDFLVQPWGKVKVPLSRGFSGVTGEVKLLVLDPAHIGDIYVQNTPAMYDVNVQVTLQNDGPSAVQRDLHVQVKDKSGVLTEQVVKGATVPPGESVQTVKISAPSAKLWDLDHPNLYTCTVSLQQGGQTADALDQTFGFRWFAPEGIGQDAVFRLNRKRIVLRTAIGWGLWGNSGLIPTPELAGRQIAAAKAFGLNMLNFHRAIGQPLVLNEADKSGLLYFEEPGCYVDGGADPFCELLVREKLLRMVKRDRSHPSLVIYNMINEQWTQYHADKNPALYANFKDDMAAAHKIDPSRVIVLASAWSYKPAGTEEPDKLNMMPFDDQQHLSGWKDVHRATGPQTWRQDFYKDPQNHYGFTDDKTEIVYWGEEGAISTPPRLELIKKEVEALPTLGWDGEIYLDWYKQFDDYLNRKNLRAAFPTVDAFCLALGAGAIEHQGRKIEDTRICNLNDGYAINGWEAEPYEDHSGVVDCFRNPKGDPKVLAYYNQPLYLAVKTRSQIVASGGSVTVDYYVINEKDVKGPHTLKVSASTPDGQVAFSKEFPVNVTGGETYGQLLQEAVSVPTNTVGGLLNLKAQLVDSTGNQVAEGHDQILVVDWKDTKLSGKGAVYENDSKVHDFLKVKMGLDVPAYADSLGPLDWVFVARSAKIEPEIIPRDALQTPDGSKPGLLASFYRGHDFSTKASEHVQPRVDFVCNVGANPDPAIPAGAEYCVRWEGKLVSSRTGGYTFPLTNLVGEATLKIDGQEVKDQPVNLTAGTPVSIQLDYVPKPGAKGAVTLNWIVPGQFQADAAALIARAQKDGTTVILADRAKAWMDIVKGDTPVTYNGTFKIGTDWAGGQYFAIDHPLFKDLPTNTGLGWPYQTVIGFGRTYYGLRLEGEQLVAGCWQSSPMALGTSVGVIPSGKGKIVVSMLDICSHLNDPSGPADVARKLLCNYILYGTSSNP